MSVRIRSVSVSRVNVSISVRFRGGCRSSVSATGDVVDSPILNTDRGRCTDA